MRGEGLEGVRRRKAPLFLRAMLALGSMVALREVVLGGRRDHQLAHIMARGRGGSAERKRPSRRIRARLLGQLIDVSARRRSFRQVSDGQEQQATLREWKISEKKELRLYREQEVLEAKMAFWGKR